MRLPVKWLVLKTQLCFYATGCLWTLETREGEREGEIGVVFCWQVMFLLFTEKVQVLERSNNSCFTVSLLRRSLKMVDTEFVMHEKAKQKQNKKNNARDLCVFGSVNFQIDEVTNEPLPDAH